MAVLGILASGYVWYTQRNSNFHVVQHGQFYRVSRVSPLRLAELVQSYGIRSVLNLEGAKPGKSWYRAEMKTLDLLGVEHYDYRISATRIVPPQQVEEVLDIIRKAPKPILVHCREGADRSGLIAALYLAKILGRNEDEAYGQLSMSYGHFSYIWSSTEEMDDTFWAAVDPARDPN